MQASKWLAHQVLLDGAEMGELFAALGEFEVYSTGRVLAGGESDDFLSDYTAYVEGLKGGQIEEPVTFSSCFSTSADAVERSAFPGGRELLRARRPVIQLQPHQFAYSRVDGRFYPMARGQGSISWGVQFSYPQLFQEGGEIVKVDQSFPNTALYRTLARWIRHNTRATPFVAEGIKQNVPIRLGKACFGWINRHPQLVTQEIAVHAS